ncbi:MFS-type transporter clz9-like [Ischnura elegans]|uniref:MFS-type transporter clz9-like n=1 Tax=Ischnura elegans TaxID=197161 RepID=UPI001ED87A79|nr:MFS-type transporter clz9-like [Ischnura elegans]
MQLGFTYPTFVFPRVKENPRLMDDAVPGSSAVYHKSGWINKDSFIAWFKMLVDFSNPFPEKPVLLLLDGHCSHTKSQELINMAREKNVIMLTSPPHTTHRLQPLDVGSMAPLQNYYEQEVRKWLFNNTGRLVTIYEVG